ncbi:MAG: ABC transporter ATP-binding protein [Candidatus Dadabacteria bacterium]|nr:ABC transporter ATP-binding protein [Candidatus Dadabacteria bacterium]
MKRPSTFDEPDKKVKGYDLNILKWIVKFALPFKGFMALALLFMVLTALGELYVPYLTKIAVDSYISTPWRAARFGAHDSEFEERIKNTYPEALIPISNNTYLTDISAIAKADRIQLEKLEIVSKESFLVINTQDFEPKDRDKALGIVEAHKDVFTKTGGLYYAPLSSVKTLGHEEKKILRFRDLSDVKKTAGIMVLVMLGVFVSSSLFTYLLQYSGQKIMHNIRTNTFSHLLSLPQPFYDKTPVGTLTTRVTNDVNAINEMYTSVIVQFVKDILVIVGVLAVMFVMNRELTLLIIGLTVLIGFFGAIFRIRLRRAYRKVRRSIAKLNAFVQESVQGILLIKLYMREKQNYERFEKVSRENFNANMEQVFAFATFRPIIEFISVFAIALILWHGGLSVLRLELTLGALIAYLSYIRMLFAPILELAERYNISQSAMAASENLYHLHMMEPEERRAAGSTARFSGSLEFKNVWFAYNGEDWVLKDVSFTLKPGETLALVGLTGSGKTTIVNLILKFYKPQKGQILFDGIPITQYDPEFLRSNISTVFQDSFLFGGNSRDTNSDGLRDIIGTENAAVLGSGNGENFSSGEKQLVSLGQAFGKEMKFLILDEATSHIDAQIEKRIQDALKRDAHKRATLIIAHRLLNAANSDKIIVVHKGEIYEEGSHAQLLEKKGIYYNLTRLQTKMHDYSSFAD